MVTLLCNILLRAAALSLAAAGVSFVVRRFSARLHPGRVYYLLLGLLLAMLLPFDLSAPSLPGKTLFTQTLSGSAAQGFQGLSQPLTGDRHFFRWTTLLALLWLAVAVGVLLVQLVRHFRFIHWVRRWAAPVEDQQTLAVYNRAAASLKVRRTPRLLRCPMLPAPALAGPLRPVLLLPEGTFPPEQLECLLRHELVHHKRKDLWARLLCMLGRSVFWFNPAVFYLIRTIEEFCELSCDRQALKDCSGEAREQYVNTMLGAIRSSSGLRAAPLTTNFNGGIRNMKRRITSILDGRAKWGGVPLILAATLLAAFIIYLVPVGIQAASGADIKAVSYETAVKEYKEFGLLYDETGEHHLYNGEPVAFFMDNRSLERGRFSGSVCDSSGEGHYLVTQRDPDSGRLLSIDEVTPQEAEDLAFWRHGGPFGGLFGGHGGASSDSADTAETAA